MKNLTPLLIRAFSSLLLLCAGYCGCPEDDILPTKFVVDDTYTFIENPDQNFQVGDTLFISTFISRDINFSDGTTLFLTDDENSGAVDFSMKLFRETGFDTFATIIPQVQDVPAFIGVIDEFSLENGFIRPSTESTDIGLESRIGIVLQEQGNYEIRSAKGPKQQLDYFIWSPNVGFNIQLTSFINESSEEGDFSFEVQ